MAREMRWDRVTEAGAGGQGCARRRRGTAARAGCGRGSPSLCRAAAAPWRGPAVRCGRRSWGFATTAFLQPVGRRREAVRSHDPAPGRASPAVVDGSRRPGRSDGSRGAAPWDQLPRRSFPRHVAFPRLPPKFPGPRRRGGRIGSSAGVRTPHGLAWPDSRARPGTCGGRRSSVPRGRDGVHETGKWWTARQGGSGAASAPVRGPGSPAVGLAPLLARGGGGVAVGGMCWWDAPTRSQLRGGL